MTERESFRKQKYGPRAARLHKKNSRSLLASLFNSRIVGHARSPPQRRSHEAANELADITKTLAQRDAPPLLLFAPSIFEYYTRIHAPLFTSRIVNEIYAAWILFLLVSIPSLCHSSILVYWRRDWRREFNFIFLDRLDYIYREEASYYSLLEL